MKNRRLDLHAIVRQSTQASHANHDTMIVTRIRVARLERALI